MPFRPGRGGIGAFQTETNFMQKNRSLSHEDESIGRIVAYKQYI